MAQRPLSIVVGLSAMLLVAGTAFGQTQPDGDMMMEPCMQSSEMIMEQAMEAGDEMMAMKPCAENGEMAMETATHGDEVMMEPAMAPSDDMIMAPGG